jgi:cobalt/nickel transport system permease protein
MSFFAVHLSDNVIDLPWYLGGYVVAFLLAFWGSWRLSEAEIPRVALLTAAFFVSSLIRIPIGPTSVHLLLSGLMGAMLGRRAAVAILIGITLQFYLLFHGGAQTIGLNTCIMAIPALLGGAVFQVLLGPLVPPASLSTEEVRQFRERLFWRATRAGAIVGGACVLLTAALNSMVLVLAGIEDFRLVASAVFLAHLPLVLVEGFVVSVIAGFLAKARPDLLHCDPTTFQEVMREQQIIPATSAE